MPMMPAISSGARVQGLVMYLAGPGKANEHTNPHVVAASSREVFSAGGSGATMTRQHAYDLGHVVDEARVVFGTDVTRRDTKALKAAMERGATGPVAVAEATRDENVWHCSLSLPPDMAALDDATWSAITHDFMAGMGFDTDGDAAARWVAIRHGLTKNGGDHVHIAASRVRDDGSVVALWRPHPDHPKRNEGDYARAQRVARTLETKYGLEVLSSHGRDMASRGRAHAQDAATTPRHRPDGTTAEPRIDEAPSVTLARRVRAAAAAAETEAEFVRMLRADDLVVRSARYDRTDRDAVTGFSVGLPASDYSNRHGQPIMHGGKKLGEDLSLPRLRERWIDDDNSRADARAAWNHADAAFPTRTASRPDPASAHRAADAPEKTAADDPEREREQQAAVRLREILGPLARGAATEADYARALRDHPDLWVRVRYAAGSDTDVAGYRVALHPRLLADAAGKAIWRNASYFGDGLSLKELRAHWPDTDAHRRLASSAWKRVTRPSSRPSVATDTLGRHSKQWEATVAGLEPTSRGWHATAADTAAAVSAAARGMDGVGATRLNELSDSLSAAAGYRRPSAAPGVHKMTSARRIAAVMLAASRDDTTLLWLATMSQVLAASRAIADAMTAQGHTRQANTIRRAARVVDLQFAGQQPINAQQSTPARVATTIPGAARGSDGLDR